MDPFVWDEVPLSKCKGILDDKYSLHQTIGKGQFAKVKLGQHLGTKRLFAVKIMKDVSSVEKLEKFMNEVRLLSSCSSSHIVDIKAVSINGTLVSPYGQKRAVVYHITQYAKNGEIYKLVTETENFDEKLARTYFIQLLKGLEYLHSIGISHRDIKPENLLLDQRFNLVIADFGSAARCRTEGYKAIEFDSNVIVGSQEYNAPEINMEKTYFGEKADIFSAGICLFFLLTGKSPFRGATAHDPHFEMLIRKDKGSFWDVFMSWNLSVKFKDLFEKITERDIIHRLDMASIWNHSWIKGETYERSELIEAMHGRVEIYQKVCLREIETKLEKEKFYAVMGRIKAPILSELIISEKAFHGDAIYKERIEECTVINEKLEIRHTADDQISILPDERRESYKEEVKLLGEDISDSD